MKKKENNYAFVDAQNLHMQTVSQGWTVDAFRLRVHLSETFGVTRAYWFVDMLPHMKDFYALVERAGFILIYKEVSYSSDGVPKGNVDVDLTLHAVDKQSEYDGAVIITSDGDFASLVRYLLGRGKLRAVLSPNKERTSRLLKKATAGGSLQYLDDARHKVQRQMKKPS